MDLSTISGDALAATDPGLPARLHAGDRAAFAALYTHTVDALTAYAARRLGEHHRDAAADVVHEAYCIALADPTLLDTDPVAAMRRLTTRTVHRHRRHQTRLGYVLYRDLPAVDGDPTLVMSPHRPRAGEAMSALSSLQRQIIRLRYTEGLSLKDTARRVGHTPGTVAGVEQAALRHLRAACTG